MADELSILVLLVGAAILASHLIRSLFARLNLPAMIGYIALGCAVSLIDGQRPFLSEQALSVIAFLAEMGIVVLLFQVGVESKIKKLVSQLGQAVLIGVTNIAVAGAVAFAAAFWLLGLETFASLLVSAALVATSVGVPASVWEEAGAIQTKQGQLLMDVAELDDIVGVVLMALLFAVIPTITEGSGGPALGVLVKTGARFVARLLLYGAGCVLFAYFAEKRLTQLLGRWQKPPEETLTVVAVGSIIAAFAGLLGFSVAIGAFFAGLVFSRDPKSIKSRTTLAVVYDLFVPFFFLASGMRMRLDTLTPALVPALVLTAAAFLGKFIGTAAPAWRGHGGRTATLLGISMIPRAEIALIISQRALGLEQAGIPHHIFVALVLTSLSTCLLPSVALGRLLRRKPPKDASIAAASQRNTPRRPR